MPKISLRHIDVVMSFRAATQERTDNLHTVLAHLDLTYCDYQLWLMEADAQPRFDWTRSADPKVRHVFMHHTGPFPKALLYNTGVRLAASPVVCLHDADSIASPAAMVYAVNELLDQDVSDAICPFVNMVNVQGATKQAFMARPDPALLAHYDPAKASAQPDFSELYRTNNGGIGVFRKSAYRRVGGYDASMEGWGGEDDELLSRARRLGVRWNSLVTPLFHLHHDSTSRIALIHDTRGSANVQAAAASEQMPLDELQAKAAQLARFFG